MRNEIGRLCLFTVALVACSVPVSSTSSSFKVIQRFEAPEARQGVAVDAAHFYAVDNRRIGKYDKHTGRRAGSWDAGSDASIIHLNSGVVVDGTLYCAHSNYPSVPMVSTIETFDTVSLTRLGSRALPNGYGSATWVDRWNGAWWVVFANYDGRGGQPGKGAAATVLVRFDSAWTRTDQYSFPAEVVRRFGGYSNSGGAWGRNGLLYATGHDGAEVYVLRLPVQGSVLDLAGIISADIDGQGIAWDRSQPDTFYGIVKKRREVVVLRWSGDHTTIEATSGK